MEGLQKLPGVDKLLNLPEIKAMIAEFNETIVKHVIRESLNHFRNLALKENAVPDRGEIIEHIHTGIQKITTKSLRNVLNATGVVGPYKSWTGTL